MMLCSKKELEIVLQGESSGVGFIKEEIE